MVSQDILPESLVTQRPQSVSQFVIRSALPVDSSACSTSEVRNVPHDGVLTVVGWPAVGFHGAITDTSHRHIAA
jgi:hypothetical protein